jgi:hypothetical protein
MKSDFWNVNSQGRCRFGDPGLHEMIIRMKEILCVKMSGLIWLRIGYNEYGNKPLLLIK